MAELHRTLELLRGEDELAERAPQPVLSDLQQLADQSRGGGLDVELGIEGACPSTPGELELCAYRIVQEALTNVRRHAGPAHATVRLRFGADALEVSIEDDGDAAAQPIRRPWTARHARARGDARRRGQRRSTRTGRLPRQRDPALPGAAVRQRLRVIIADDQPLLRAGFRALLESAGDIEIVAEAGTGEEAVEQARRHLPDVVLMDIRMPGMDGIEATRQLTRTRVLILTTFGLDEYIIQALRAGASGFILKDTRVEDLLHAVRTVAAGEAFLSPAVTRQLLDQVARRLPAAVDRRPSSSPSSPSASWRCCGCSPPDSATPRSPPRWSSAKRPSRHTCPRSSRN